MARMEKGYQKNTITLVLNNSEVDTLKLIFENDDSELGEYIKSRISKMQAN